MFRINKFDVLVCALVFLSQNLYQLPSIHGTLWWIIFGGSLLWQGFFLGALYHIIEVQNAQDQSQK